MLLNRSIALAFSISSIGLAIVFKIVRRLIDGTADRRCRTFISGPFPMEYSLSSSDLIEQTLVEIHRDIQLKDYFIYLYICNVFF